MCGIRPRMGSGTGEREGASNPKAAQNTSLFL